MGAPKWEDTVPIDSDTAKASTIVEKLLPTAAKIQGEGGKQSAARILMGVLDALSVPSRALASATTSQKFSDPDAYAAKPLVENVSLTIDRQTPKPGGAMLPSRGGVPGGVGYVPNAGGKEILKGAAEFAGRTVTDPLSLTGVGAARKAGSKMMEKAVGLTQSQIKIPGLRKAAEKTMSPEQAKTFLEEFSSVKGLKGASKNLENAHDAINAKFTELVNNIAAKKKVDIKGTFSVVESDLAKMEKSGEIDLNQIAALRKQIQDWKEAVKPLTNAQGFADFPVAQNFKTKTLGPAAKYDKIPSAPNPGELSGKASAARMTREELTKQMVQSEPRLAELNKEFSKIAGIEKFVDPALEAAARNNMFSMQDLFTGGIGGTGATAAALSGKPELGLLALLPFLASRAQKSPGLTAAMYKAGKAANQAGINLYPTAIERAIEAAGRSGD